MNIKNALGILALLGMIAGGAWVNHLRVKAGKYDQAKEQLADLRAAHTEYVQLRDRADADKAAASQGYQNELTTLRADFARRPVPVVRLCSQPAANLPAREGAAGGLEATAAAAGLVQPGTAADSEGGPDIGPALARLADRADSLAAQCRAIINYMGN